MLILSSCLWRTYRVSEVVIPGCPAEAVIYNGGTAEGLSEETAVRGQNCVLNVERLFHWFVSMLCVTEIYKYR
jgi:hypothetical protein